MLHYACRTNKIFLNWSLISSSRNLESLSVKFIALLILNLVLDGAGWAYSPHRPIQKQFPVHIVEKAGWAPEPIWKFWRRKKFPSFTEILIECLQCRSLISLLKCTLILQGISGSAIGWGTVLQTGRSRVRFPMVPLEFFIDIILPVAIWPLGRLSLQQKWVPGIFPRGKGGRYVGLTTLPPSCADCLEIWEPQASGILKACLGL
jgi:hypothetical protein